MHVSVTFIQTELKCIQALFSHYQNEYSEDFTKL